MKETIEALLARYGQTLTLCQGEEEQTVQAFFQPAASQHEQVPDAMSPIRWLDGRRWIYLGIQALSPGDRVIWESMPFRVCSSRAYAVGTNILYWWASLEREESA